LRLGVGRPLPVWTPGASGRYAVLPDPRDGAVATGESVLLRRNTTAFGGGS
jgi:hypothetical protein